MHVVQYGATTRRTCHGRRLPSCRGLYAYSASHILYSRNAMCRHGRGGPHPGRVITGPSSGPFISTVLTGPSSVLVSFGTYKGSSPVLGSRGTWEACPVNAVVDADGHTEAIVAQCMDHTWAVRATEMHTKCKLSAYKQCLPKCLYHRPSGCN
eukprot:jgi/Mesvir1/285/Mv25426-RA.1